jgi:hypothetical protein
MSKPRPVHGELLICAEFREFWVSRYDMALRDLLILLIRLITTAAGFASPGAPFRSCRVPVRTYI